VIAKCPKEVIFSKLNIKKWQEILKHFLKKKTRKIRRSVQEYEAYKKKREKSVLKTKHCNKKYQIWQTYFLF
jgi:hypothetical protein